MKRQIIYILVMCSLFVFGSLQAQPFEDFPINFERTSDRVLVIKGGNVYFDQIVAIASQKGLVVIDTGKAPTFTREYRKIIEREFGRNDFLYVINTHYHFDHTDGNQVFADARAIISHEKSPDLMRGFDSNRADFIAARKPRMKEWISQRDAAEPGSHEFLYYNDIVASNYVMTDDLANNYILTLPTLTFSDRLMLDLGDLTLNLYYFGEGLHTGDDILIHCPEEKLLFTGDLFYKGSLRCIYQSEFDADRWIDVINEILSEDGAVEFAYDTHNGRMSGEFIALWRDYLVDMYEGLKSALKSGLDFAEIEKMFAYDLKFRYLEKSGLDPQRLKQDHEESLKLMWARLTK